MRPKVEKALRNGLTTASEQRNDVGNGTHELTDQADGLGEAGKAQWGKAGNTETARAASDSLEEVREQRKLVLDVGESIGDTRGVVGGHGTRLALCWQHVSIWIRTGYVGNTW